MEDSSFEQKLATYQPRLLRDIKSEIMRPQSMMEHLIALRPLRNFHDPRSPKSELRIGVCCFLLGALAMFVVMTCCFDRVPMGSRALVADHSPKVKPVQTYTVPLRMQDLDGITSPAALMAQIRQLPVIVVEPEPERNVLRAFPINCPVKGNGI
jgi:hypothetical protein